MRTSNTPWHMLKHGPADPDALPRNTATVLGVGTLLRRREKVDLARWSSPARHADLVEICSEKASEDDRMLQVGRDLGGIGAGLAPERPYALEMGLRGRLWGETSRGVAPESCRTGGAAASRGGPGCENANILVGF